MGCKIVFAPQAINDLAQVVRHIARDDPETALRIGNELIDRVAILESFPLIGSPYPKSPGGAQAGLSPLHHFLSAEPGGWPCRYSALLARRARRTGIQRITFCSSRQNTFLRKVPERDEPLPA